MSNDDYRNEPYREALRQTARGQAVADLGTGADLLWARAALDAGARKVYAIESLEGAAERAKALSTSLGAGDSLEVIQGYSQEVTLDERVDILVIEMAGSIGSAEGIAAVARDAVDRMLETGGLVIPAQVDTRVCGISLPDELANDPGFTEDAADYVEQIWEAQGGPSDLKLSVRGIERENVLTTSFDIEQLELVGTNAPEGSVTGTLRVERAGRLDGLLLWTRVSPLPDMDPIETFPTRGSSGLPSFVPLFHPGISVAAGDTVETTFRRTLCGDGFHPDYRFEVTVRRGGAENASATPVELHYRGGPLAQNAFYASIWSN
jgi:protein arginine N-methyltransferase 1